MGQSDDRGEALGKGYPLHPELIDTLMQKTATLENFQRVRGMLRLLAQTVAQLWREKPGDATAIHLHHIDPGNERIRLEISTKLGLQAFVPAIRADVARTTDEDGKALAQQLDAGEFAGLAPYGSLAARTVLLHSLAFNEPLKGLSRLELNYSLYAPGLDPAFIDKAVRHLQEASEYLDDSTTSKLRVLTEANLNQMVRKREGQFDLETVRQELNRHIAAIFAKARQCFEPVVFPASPAEIPDDTDGPYLAVLHWEGHTVAQDNVHLPELVVRLFKERGDNANTRRNRNNLVFVCADGLQVDDMLRKTRTTLALGQMQRGDLFASLQSHQQEQVKERHGRAQQAFALAVQQAYRHVFYPERGPWPEVALVHAAITVTNASSEPGVGQKQVERVLREAGELILPDDAPPAPNFMADKTPLRRCGVMSSRDLRNKYHRDPALPILIGDEVLKKCLRMGLDKGVFVYKEGERLEGKDQPPGTLNISEDAKVYMLEKAEELGVWPPRTAAPELAFTGGGDSSNANNAVAGSRGRGVAPPTTPTPPGMLERTGNIKTVLTQLAQQVSNSGKGVCSLTWRMNSGDGFVPPGLAQSRAGRHGAGGDGGWSSGGGAAEWSFEFKGTPEEATILRSFIEGQWRRGGEKSLDVKYKLTYAPPLIWSDQGEDWIRRLTRAGLSTQMATIGLELSGPTIAVPSGCSAYELRSRQRGPSDLLLEVWQVHCGTQAAAPDCRSWRP